MPPQITIFFFNLKKRGKGRRCYKKKGKEHGGKAGGKEKEKEKEKDKEKGKEKENKKEEGKEKEKEKRKREGKRKRKQRDVYFSFSFLLGSPGRPARMASFVKFLFHFCWNRKRV